jgi:hypothetical protein
MPWRHRAFQYSTFQSPMFHLKRASRLPLVSTCPIANEVSHASAARHLPCLFGAYGERRDSSRCVHTHQISPLNRQGTALDVSDLSITSPARMSNFLIAVASFVAIAEAFVVLHTEGAVVNFTGHSTNSVRGSGILQVPVARRHHHRSKQKRQSVDGLRNDISGYSIQSETPTIFSASKSDISLSALEHPLRV